MAGRVTHALDTRTKTTPFFFHIPCLSTRPPPKISSSVSPIHTDTALVVQHTLSVRAFPLFCHHGGSCQGRAGADRAPGGAEGGAAAGRRPRGRPGRDGRFRRGKGGRGARGGGGVRGPRVLQGDGPRRAAGAPGAHGGRDRRLLRAPAAGEGGRHVGRSAGQPVRVREQADWQQRRPRVGRVPPARCHRRRCLDGGGLLRRAIALALALARGGGAVGVARLFPRSPERLHGGGEEDDLRGAGAHGGRAGHGAGRLREDGPRRGERLHAAREPLPAAARDEAASRRRWRWRQGDRLRRAHRPADHLRAPLQRHLRPRDRAARRHLGLGAAGPELLLRQRRRRTAGSDEWEVQEREAPGDGEQRPVAGVSHLLRWPGTAGEAGAAAAARRGRGAPPVQGVHMAGVQGLGLQDQACGEQALPL